MKNQVEKSEVIEFANTLPACFAYEENENEVYVTYRGKKSEKIFIDVSIKKVSYSGSTLSVAKQIAEKFNFKIV